MEAMQSEASPRALVGPACTGILYGLALVAACLAPTLAIPVCSPPPLPSEEARLRVVVYHTTPCLPEVGLVVRTNGGLTAVTDSLGIARFEEIAAGWHRVSIVAARGEQHRQVRVPVDGTAAVFIPID